MTPLPRPKFQTRCRHRSVIPSALTLTQSSIPPFSLPFPPSPDTLDGGFPLGPPPPGKEALPEGPAERHMLPEEPRLYHWVTLPHVAGGHALLTQMFPLGTFCVFSSNITNPRCSSSSGKALRYQIYSGAPSVFFIYCVECSWNPSLTRLLYFLRKRQTWIPFWLAFLGALGLNVVWTDMLLKCKSSLLLPRQWFYYYFCTTEGESEGDHEVLSFLGGDINQRPLTFCWLPYSLH